MADNLTEPCYCSLSSDQPHYPLTAEDVVAHAAQAEADHLSALKRAHEIARDDFKAAQIELEKARNYMSAIEEVARKEYRRFAEVKKRMEEKELVMLEKRDLVDDYHLRKCVGLRYDAPLEGEWLMGGAAGNKKRVNRDALAVLDGVSAVDAAAALSLKLKELRFEDLEREDKEGFLSLRDEINKLLEIPTQWPTSSGMVDPPRLETVESFSRTAEITLADPSNVKVPGPSGSSEADSVDEDSSLSDEDQQLARILMGMAFDANDDEEEEEDEYGSDLE